MFPACQGLMSSKSIFISLFLRQQFFKHDFSETHVRTAKPFRYRSCLVCDTMIRELIVLDVPPQVSRRQFPKAFIEIYAPFPFFSFLSLRSRKFQHNRKNSPSTISPNGITTKIPWVFEACRFTYWSLIWETWKRFK